MRYGFYLPTRGPTATRAGVLALAREGERLGLHSAMIADHIVFPVESESAYPYTLDRKHPGGGDALETFSILGVVAGATERLRLVTSVLVLPYRNPVLTAKMVASLDVLSGGRVTLGVGVGWLKEEFEALDSPDFDRRGAVTDGHEIAVTDEDVGFTEGDAALDQLRRARDDEQGLAILLDLGPLMGVVGVLDGEFVQVELLLHRAEQRHVGLVQPDPDHMAGLGPPARSLADGDIGDAPAVDIGAGSDDALGGHRFGLGCGRRRDIHGFNPGRNRLAKMPRLWPVHKAARQG